MCICICVFVLVHACLYSVVWLSNSIFLWCQCCCKHRQPTMIVFFMCHWPTAGSKWHKRNIQLEPSEILVWLKRVSGDNPVFLDPVTSRHLVVLARSWSCQPSIYGRSVFNLQKQTLPEYRERMKEREWVKWSQYFCLCLWVPSGPSVSELCREW